MSKTLLDDTIKNASFNVMFQILAKVVTFLLNAFAIRHITKDVVGVINVRLLLLESTILFVSREAFRKAALSQTHSKSWVQIINLMWLTIPLSVVMSVCFAFIWLYLLQNPSFNVTQHYAIGVWCVSMGCIIEMFAEPLQIVSQAYSFIKLKVVLATLALFIRSLIFILWIKANPQYAVIAFSFAHIFSNLFLSVGFYSFFYIYIHTNCKNANKINYKFLRKKSYKGRSFENFNSKLNDKFKRIQQGDILKQKNRLHLKSEKQKDKIVQLDEPFPFSSILDFLPQSLPSQNLIDPKSAELTWNFFKQGILKQILTEGERYIMTLFSVMTFKEQGVYDVVNNLGSLVVRFLFRPVEDSLYFYFTQSIERDKKINKQNWESMKEAATVLKHSLSTFVAIGILIFIFGQSYSALLLGIYGGEDLAAGDGPALLKAHSFSVLLLGINGITECYAFATMSSDQLHRHNYLMGVFSAFFLIISWGLTRIFGGIGFVLANCCNMSARILCSLFFIKSKYAETSLRPIQGLIPAKFYGCSLIIILIVTKISESSCTKLQHFFIGAICFLIAVAIWSTEKKDLVILAIEKLLQKKMK